MSAARIFLLCSRDVSGPGWLYALEAQSKADYEKRNEEANPRYLKRLAGVRYHDGLRSSKTQLYTIRTETSVQCAMGERKGRLRRLGSFGLI